MTDNEILIWYEGLERVTCNTNEPEKAIVGYVRELIKQRVRAAVAEYRQIVLGIYIQALENNWAVQDVIDAINRAPLDPDPHWLEKKLLEVRTEEANWWKQRCSDRLNAQGDGERRLAALAAERRALDAPEGKS
jgi:hypothetical protein